MALDDSRVWRKPREKTSRAYDPSDGQRRPGSAPTSCASPASGPPPQPGPGASREEWRAWRHQQHDYWRQQRHAGDWYGPYPWVGPWNWWGGGWFWGAVLVLIGVFYLLQNLGLLTRIPGDVLWPLLLILLGAYLLLRRSRWGP